VRIIGVLALLAGGILSWLVNSTHRYEVFGFMGDIPGKDRTGHFVVFFFFCLAINLGFADLRVNGRRLGMRLLTLLVILGATLDEYSQNLLPWRSADPIDLIAGYGGIALAVLLMIPFARSGSATVESPAD